MADPIKALNQIIAPIREEARKEGFMQGYQQAWREIKEMITSKGQSQPKGKPSSKAKAGPAKTKAKRDMKPRGANADVILGFLRSRPDFDGSLASEMKKKGMGKSSFQHALKQLVDKGKVEIHGSNYRIRHEQGSLLEQPASE
jgi:hypothetical protein